MSEWTIVGVLVVLVGLFFAIYTPIAKRAKEHEDERVETERLRTLATEKNTEVMTRLTVSLEHFGTSLSEFKDENSESHKRLWVKNDEQDKQIVSHETRIGILEHQKGDPK